MEHSERRGDAGTGAQEHTGGARSGVVWDAIWLLVLVAGLLLVYLSTYAVHRYPFPVGPDAPVYLWWARLAGAEGLSAVDRPGVPTLTLVVTGALGSGTAAVVAALEVALAVTIGLGAAALVAVGDRDGRGRGSWVLSGALAGLFAVHLALGYVATLAVAALFLGAAAALAGGTGRGALGAAALLGAAAFAHRQFLAVGAVVLLVSALPSFLRDRGRGPFLDSEYGRIAVAIGGGAVIAGLGTLALLHGPAAIHVDTSRDDFLERAGLGSMLTALFRDRLADHAPLFVPWLAVPLAVLGAWRASGFLRPFLRAWGVVLLAGGAVAYLTGLFPAERLVTFAFVLPIGAALGLVALWRRIAGGAPRVPRAALATVLVTALAAPMAIVAIDTWERTPPKIFPTEVERVTEAGRYAAATPPGTRLVFTVSGRQPIASFFATEAANAIRAAVPPDRIRDVRVVIPAGIDPLALRSDEGRRLVDLYDRLAFTDLPPGGDVLWFDLAPFDRTDFARPFGATSPDDPRRLTPRIVSQGVAIVGKHPVPVREADDPLRASSPKEIAAATLATLVLLLVAGYGWAHAAVGGGLGSFALAPAFGAAGMILAGLVLDRVGIPLTGRVGPAGATSIVAVGGYLVLFLIRKRRASARSKREPSFR